MRYVVRISLLIMGLFVLPVVFADGIGMFGIGLHPSGIDRRVVEKVPYPVVVQPFLRVQNGAEVASISVVCDEEFLFEPVRVLSETKSPLLLFKFSADVVDKDVVEVGCMLQVVTSTDGVVGSPAIVNLSVRVLVYNSPLGTVDDAVQLKIAGLDARINNLETEAKKWSVVNQVLGRISGVAETVVQADAVVSVLNFVTWLIPLISSFHQVVCHVHMKLHYDVVLDMWPPGSVPRIGEPAPFSGYAASGKLPLVKVAALINSCQLCDFSGKLSIGGGPLSGELRVDLLQEGLSIAGGKSAERTDGIVSVLSGVESDVFDPQKSIHVAAACLCPQGIEYNLKKERQVACRLRSCVKEFSKKGLSLGICERAHAVENCLFVEGASWKLAGGPALSAVLSRLLSGINDNLPSSVMGAVWQRFCMPDTGSLVSHAYQPCNRNIDPAGAAGVAVCGVMSVPPLLFETGFFDGNKFDWNQYDTKLRGVDFCD